MDHPTVILVSCNTGQLGGIGQELSKIGGTILAPDRTTNVESISPKISPDGTLVLHVSYHKAATKKYVNGQEQTSRKPTPSVDITVPRL